MYITENNFKKTIHLSVNKLGKVILNFSVFFICLELYRIPVGSLNATISSLLELLLLFLIFLKLVKGIRLNDKKIFFIMIYSIFFIYSIFNVYIFSNNFSLARDLLTGEALGFVFIIGMPIFINDFKSFNKLINWFLRGSFFVYIFNIYGLIYFIINNQILKKLPLMFLPKSGRALKYIYQAHNWNGFPTFRWPFSSGASTGFYLAIIGIILFWKVIKNSKSRYFYWFIFNFIILLGTFSRTGIIILMIGITIQLILKYYTLGLFKFETSKLLKVLIIFGIIFLIFLIIYPEFINSVLSKWFSKKVEMSNAGHIKTRILAYEAFTQAPFFGIGIGNLSIKYGMVHAHSTYMSILAERGIIGFLLFILLNSLGILMLFKKIPFNSNSIVFISLGIALFLVHLLYQKDNSILWLSWAFIYTFIGINHYRIKDNVK